MLMILISIVIPENAMPYHVTEHENENDCDPHQKCFVTQNLPVKQGLCFCLTSCDVTVVRAHVGAWPINQCKSRQKEKYSREHAEHVNQSNMNEQLLHGRAENTASDCTTEGHYTIGKAKSDFKVLCEYQQISEIHQRRLHTPQQAVGDRAE